MWKPRSPFFVNAINSEDRKIEELLELPAFTLKKKPEGRQKREEKKSPWNIFNMIPTHNNGYKDNEAERYRLKMLCNVAADGDAKTQEWLFEEKSLLFVYEQIMFRKARNYELYS